MLPAGEATGPCKARALAQQLWDGEEFYLQARTGLKTAWNCVHSFQHAMPRLNVQLGVGRMQSGKPALVVVGANLMPCRPLPSLFSPCLQIDSHMRFVEGWDTLLLRMLSQVRRCLQCCQRLGMQRACGTAPGVAAVLHAATPTSAMQAETAAGHSRAVLSTYPPGYQVSRLLAARSCCNVSFSSWSCTMCRVKVARRSQCAGTQP